MSNQKRALKLVLVLPEVENGKRKSVLPICISFLQFGGASWWRVCYQLGLPRLVKKKSFWQIYFNEQRKTPTH